MDNCWLIFPMIDSENFAHVPQPRTPPHFKWLWRPCSQPQVVRIDATKPLNQIFKKKGVESHEFYFLITEFSSIKNPLQSSHDLFLQPCSTRRNLRLYDQGLLVVPLVRLKTKGDSVFELISPKLWSSLWSDLGNFRWGSSGTSCFLCLMHVVMSGHLKMVFK